MARVVPGRTDWRAVTIIQGTVDTESGPIIVIGTTYEELDDLRNTGYGTLRIDSLPGLCVSLVPMTSAVIPPKPEGCQFLLCITYDESFLRDAVDGFCHYHHNDYHVYLFVDATDAKLLQRLRNGIPANVPLSIEGDFSHAELPDHLN